MAACDLRRLVACEEQGLAWQAAAAPESSLLARLSDAKPVLMAAAPSDGFRWPGKCAGGCKAGEWYAPCAEAHGAAACRRTRSPLVVLAHLPKAGGTSLGHALAAALQGRLSACHLSWSRARVHTRPSPP